MKKLSLNAAAFQKGEVLRRSQLKKVLGGDGSGGGSGGSGDLGCQPGDTLMYTGPEGCGTALVIIKLPNGECLYAEPVIHTLQPCGYA